EQLVVLQKVPFPFGSCRRDGSSVHAVAQSLFAGGKQSLFIDHFSLQLLFFLLLQALFEDVYLVQGIRFFSDGVIWGGAVGERRKRDMPIGILEENHGRDTSRLEHRTIGTSPVVRYHQTNLA